ncbi:MFS transporter [Caballeronia sp. LjRoot34]|uniref:MFS transporter n=1 Tax=Caballeronia sp. LjRoot34 TaxID=3342325 RepID=UPI003ECC87C2
MRALLVLMLGAFVAQTTEYLPIGLLPQIAHGLDVSEARVGALVTGYAWVAAITAIPLTLATQRLARRRLLMSLLGVMTATNTLAAFSSSYLVLATLRVATALTHGVFWSMIAAYAVQLEPDVPATRATAIALGGIPLALVVGVPIATAIGHWIGWRNAFAAYAVLGGIAILLSARYLPAAVDSNIGIEHGVPHGNASLYWAALATTLTVTTHFIGYTYIVPVLSDVVHLPVARHAAMLMTFGLAGAAGTIVAGWLDQPPKRLSIIAAGGVTASQGAILLTGSDQIAVWLEMALWGWSISTLIVGLQSWAIAIAPHRANTASSLYVAAFNMGIGTGALIGGAALDADGVASVLKVGVVTGSIALLSFTMP